MSEEWRRPSPAGLCGEYRHSRKGPIFSLGEPGACRSLRKSGATGAVGLLHLAFLGCQIPAVTDSNASRSQAGNHYWTKQAEQKAENHRAHGCQQTTALRRPGPQLLDCLSFQAILGIPCQWDLGRRLCLLVQVQVQVRLHYWKQATWPWWAHPQAPESLSYTLAK